MIHSFQEVKSGMKMPRDRDRVVKFLENSQDILENRESILYNMVIINVVFECYMKLNFYTLHA